MTSEDGFERDYYVSEEVPAMQNDHPDSHGFPSLPEFGVENWQGYQQDLREDALVCELESLEVRLIKAAEYQTENHSVRRYRSQYSQDQF